MQRRGILSLLLSGASASALAACGGGSDAADTPDEQAASSAQESNAQPTAESTRAAEVAPTAAPTLDMPMLGKAPEINLDTWFNSEPITMASLEGKAAALVVFWTYT